MSDRPQIGDVIEHDGARWRITGFRWERQANAYAYRLECVTGDWAPRWVSL